jgi:hypothetical protein
MQNMCVFFCFPPAFASSANACLLSRPALSLKSLAIARSRAHSFAETRTDTTHAFQAHVRSQVWIFSRTCEERKKERNKEGKQARKQERETENERNQARKRLID